MSQACAALSDLDFSNDDSSSSEKDEKVKRKPDDFTGLCLMGKSSRHISDSNSNVSDDLSPESLSLRVVELENALCNQGKLLCKVFCENKKLNLELESVFLKLLLFDPCMMIRVQSQVITALWSWLTMRICGSCILMLIGCLMVPDWNSESSKLIPDYLVLAPLVPCLDLIWRLWSLRLKILSTNLIILKHKLDHSSYYSVLSSPCDACGSLKGKLFHATKENTELQQEVAYLTARL
jgi:hypothetical protein